MQTYTAKSVTFIRITATNRQERAIWGIKLLPNVQLIKQMVAWPHFRTPATQRC